MTEHLNDQLHQRRQRRKEQSSRHAQHHPHPSELPSDNDLATLRADLLARAHAVQTHGWERYLPTWTYDDIAATAYLLTNHATLAAAGYTDDDTFLRHYSRELFGTATGLDNLDDRLHRTRKWFLTTRTHLIT